MKHGMLFLLLGFFSTFTYSADLPEVIDQNQATDKQMCIDRAANDCVNTVCMNSSSIDCTDNCKTKAQDQCKEMSEE